MAQEVGDELAAGHRPGHSLQTLGQIGAFLVTCQEVGLTPMHRAELNLQKWYNGYKLRQGDHWESLKEAVKTHSLSAVKGAIEGFMTKMYK